MLKKLNIRQKHERYVEEDTGDKIHKWDGRRSCANINFSSLQLSDTVNHQAAKDLKKRSTNKRKGEGGWNLMIIPYLRIDSPYSWVDTSKEQKGCVLLLFMRSLPYSKHTRDAVGTFEIRPPTAFWFCSIDSTSCDVNSFHKSLQFFCEPESSFPICPLMQIRPFLFLDTHYRKLSATTFKAF